PGSGCRNPTRSPATGSPSTCAGGDRPPGFAPAGAGELRGVGFATTGVEILAGLMAGLCRLVADDLAVLESTVETPMEVVLGGGAMAASAWWRSAFATALAPRPVRHRAEPEIGAIGAALVALGRVAEAGRLAMTEPPDEGRAPERSGAAS
ncbi:hypothetical protein ABT214_29570, partial [Micromonospora purpureochromogenes]